MRRLTIECSSEACSVALFDDAHCIAGEYVELGRGHAEHLIPMIADLPAKGRADEIWVSRGPGSFTGIRIGIAAARALALAWDAPCYGYSALALIAAQARQNHASGVTVCINGGHGEYYVQNFGADGIPTEEPRSLSPDLAIAACKYTVIAGNKAEELVQTVKRKNGDDANILGYTILPLLPDARHSNLLHNKHLSQDVTPLYIRAPDAKAPS